MAPGVSSLPILAEPLKEERINWDRSMIEGIMIEGLLRVTYKETDYFYIQMKCPKELKCNGSKAYVPLNMTYDLAHETNPFKSYYKIPEKFSFILGPPAKIAAVKEFHAWLEKPGRVLPGAFDEVIMRHYLKDQEERGRLEKRIAQLFLVSRFIKEKTLTERTRPLLAFYLDLPPEKKSRVPLKKVSYKKESAVNESSPKSAKPPGAAPGTSKDQQVVGKKPAEKAKAPVPEDPFAKLKKGQMEFIGKLHKYVAPLYAEKAKNFMDDFPYSGNTYREVAGRFNRIDETLKYRERILVKLLTKVPYEVSGLENVRFFNGEEKVVKELMEKERAKKAASIAAAKKNEGVKKSSEKSSKDSGNILPAVKKPEPAGEPEPANVKIAPNLRYAEGVRINYTLAGRKQELVVDVATAYADENGLGFRIKSGDKTLTLKPMRESDYLKQITEKDIKNIVKKLPGNYRDLIGQFDYREAAMYLALKYGKGKYNTKERLFTYAVDLSKNNNFWKALALVKSHKLIGGAGRGDFSGEIETGRTFEGGKKDNLTWYQRVQKKLGRTSFNLRGTQEFCARDCFTRSFKLTCFDNTSTMLVSFSAADLRERTSDEKNSRIYLKYSVPEQKEVGSYLLGQCNRMFGIKADKLNDKK